MSFTVAIVGRPNVGKSTLYNRLISERKAIVDDISGVTRDRQYGVSEWNGKSFNVIDTGGFVLHSDDVFEKAIRSQVMIAIEEASLIIFMVDVTVGITDLDWQMAEQLRKSPKKVLVAVNKVDNNKRLMEVAEFYSLGIHDVIPLSSINGSGTGELLDVVATEIKEPEEVLEDDIPKIAILGQPNVGKSSLLNALVGEERNIVTDIAGTTRDTIHTRYNQFNRDFLLIDTAGIRKKAKVHEDLEFYSVIRAIKAIDEADVVILMIDAQAGIEQQDLNIFSQAIKKRKGVVLAVNKWDLVEKETDTTLDYQESILKKTAPFTDLPIVFISALEKQRIMKTLDMALNVYKNRQNKISTSKLNEFLAEATYKFHPPAVKGRHIKIKYLTQLPTATPQFAFFCNHPKLIREPYRNYLENRLREQFNFKGVPIALYFREK